MIVLVIKNYHSRLGVGSLRLYQFVPPNLAANLDARKRSDVMTFFEKRGSTSTFSSPRVRSNPLWLLGLDVTGDQSEGSKLTLVFTRTSYLGF